MESKRYNRGFLYIESDMIITDTENKIISFYSDGECIAKIPIAHMVSMGVIDGRKEGGNEDEITE